MTIGIDPDIDKSGICTIDEGRVVELCSLSFPKTIDYLVGKRDETGGNLRVHIEASWLINTNWHLSYHQSQRVSSAIGMSIGRNHEVGILIGEMCGHLGIPYSLQKPLVKRWRGKDGKISHEELERVLHAEEMAIPKGRTNQEERDACLIAFVNR